MYTAVTRAIEVSVEPIFMPERSSADDHSFFWAYRIAITNHGTETVQLKTRHWIITDAEGRQQVVRGEGVIGEQPTLRPGETFEYTSGVPLRTSSGFMTGRYQMVTDRGENFEIDIPLFSLDCPSDFTNERRPSGRDERTDDDPASPRRHTPTNKTLH